MRVLIEGVSLRCQEARLRPWIYGYYLWFHFQKSCGDSNRHYCYLYY